MEQILMVKETRLKQKMRVMQTLRHEKKEEANQCSALRQGFPSIIIEPILKFEKHPY
jgi:hypothetical protein